VAAFALIISAYLTISLPLSDLYWHHLLLRYSSSMSLRSLILSSASTSSGCYLSPNPLRTINIVASMVVATPSVPVGIALTSLPKDPFFF
jgi:hypothetical protein